MLSPTDCSPAPGGTTSHRGYPWPVFLLGLLALTHPTSAATGAGNRLFILERDQNKNRVIYEARLTAGAFDPRNPIHPYWEMLAEQGQTEELTTLEKSHAYGVTIRQTSARETVFSCKALPSYAIRATVDTPSSAVRATIELLKKNYVLERVFLHTSGFGPIRRVRIIDMHCRELETGRSLKIVLTPASGGGWQERLE